jgi:UDP-N-acetylglucosamine 2-epimerase (non-hydrolysing)
MCVVGARPNFVKIAPIMAACARRTGLRAKLVHTGQHYDARMSDAFFRDLGIPDPDVHLGVGSGTHAEQTGRVMIEFEKVLAAERPALTVVVGDVNSTLACALTAAKLHVPVAHVEAGLRSGDRTMPEETNRLLTDQLADLLFTTEREAERNLRGEGVPSDRIHFVGNVMIDSLLQFRDAAERLATWRRFGCEAKQYGFVTLHRPSNVDDPATLERLIRALAGIADSVPLLFPMHPRTSAKLDEFGLRQLVSDSESLKVTEPLGYVECLSLMSQARLVLTDSGGVQEETTALGIPCLTLRDNTERPITCTEGTNTLVGTDPRRIRTEAENVLTGGGKAGRLPELWDGHAAERIVEIIEDFVACRH